MLPRIVKITKEATCKIEDGTLFCNNYMIADKDSIEFLETENILENIVNTKCVGDIIDLELSLARLNSIGFYEDCDTFVLKNKCSVSDELYYIYDIQCFSSEANEFIIKHRTIINLIASIKNIAKHSYIDTDIENAIVFREDKSIFLPFKYTASDIKLLNIKDVEKLNLASNIFFESNSEKKLIFINELIDFLVVKEEINRFQHLLLYFLEFYDKSIYSYQFYLSDFSYNRLKIELDSKALEYTQKIQAVINDSQTKLIAIPTAFVLVFATFDFVNLFVVKNIVTMISLFIFAILIQLFLNNQKSTLNFISENIDSYKASFIKNNIEKVSNKFALVEKELKTQKNRLGVVEIILWSIPFSLVYLWFLLINLQPIPNIIGLIFILVVVILKIFIR